MDPNSAPIYDVDSAVTHIAQTTGESLDEVSAFVDAHGLYQFALMRMSEPHLDPEIDALAKAKLETNSDLFPHGFYISIPHQLAYVVRKTGYSPSRCATMLAAEAEYAHQIGIIDAEAVEDVAYWAHEAAREMEDDN